MRNRLLGLALIVSLGLNIGLLWQRFGGDTGARGREQGAPCGWQSSPLRSLLGLSDKQVEAMERERRQLLAQVAPRGAQAGQTLHWAAPLHEIGACIAHSGYHRHGAYILEHTDAAGFTQSELARLALLVALGRFPG